MSITYKLSIEKYSELTYNIFTGISEILEYNKNTIPLILKKRLKKDKMQYIIPFIHYERGYKLNCYHLLIKINGNFRIISYLITEKERLVYLGEQYNIKKDFNIQGTTTNLIYITTPHNAIKYKKKYYSLYDFINAYIKYSPMYKANINILLNNIERSKILGQISKKYLYDKNIFIIIKQLSKFF